MSIFGNIVSAIFGRGSTAAAAPGTTPATGSPPTVPAGGTGQPMTRQQLEAHIQAIADSTGRKDYNWKQSIVDLMKLLNLDSSLNARKQLAQELGYTGALDGSAEMNVWLHQQVMTKLMASGGRVPAELQH
jgi:hypothetical protein